MNISEQGVVQIEDLFCDEIMRARLGTSYNKNLILHQLQDPSLSGLNLSEVCEMDMETLISDVLQVDDLVLTEQAEFVATLEHEQTAKEQKATRSQAITCERSESEKLIHITFDKSMVTAYIEITEPGENETLPTAVDIRNALSRSKIVYGIKDDYVERIVTNPIFNRKFKIAQGKAALDGIDGSVHYHFTPVLDLAPKINEHGIADYKTLDYVQNIKKGDLLCDIVRSSLGVPGISVLGDIITGASGKPSGLVCGVNTVLSDDRTKLYASCDGQAFLRGRMVYVGRVLVLDKVDASTGNILFVGSVHILGDVASGYSVRAGGNITIDGVAENAVLVAGNNIIICGGVKGQGKGIVAAEGNIRAVYIENARVQAVGNIYADSILNSQIESARTVKLFGKSGKLIGGICTAGESVQAMQIGNDSHLSTVVNVRDPDTFGKQKAQNMLTIAKYKEAIVRLTDVAEFAAASHLDIAPPEVMLSRAVFTKIRMERAIEMLEMQNLEACEHKKRRRNVEVKDDIFPNVTFTIDGITYKNEVLKPGCNVTKAANNLVFRTY